MKKVLFIICAVLLFASTADAQFGGKVGFRRTILRAADQQLDLGAPVPGLTFSVPMNEVVETIDGSDVVTKDATWGLMFNTSTISDKDTRITSVDANFWNSWRRVDVIYGIQLSFIDAGGIVPEPSKTVGVDLALRFKAAGLPAEFGGAVARGYSGIDDLWLTDIHLGLVGQF